MGLMDGMVSLVDAPGQYQDFVEKTPKLQMVVIDAELKAINEDFSHLSLEDRVKMVGYFATMLDHFSKSPLMELVSAAQFANTTSDVLTGVGIKLTKQYIDSQKAE